MGLGPCYGCETCHGLLGDAPTALLVGGQQYADPDDCPVCGHLACPPALEAQGGR